MASFKVKLAIKIFPLASIVYYFAMRYIASYIVGYSIPHSRFIFEYFFGFGAVFALTLTFHDQLKIYFSMFKTQIQFLFSGNSIKELLETKKKLVARVEKVLWKVFMSYRSIRT